jgi:hypothetical protein
VSLCLMYRVVCHSQIQTGVCLMLCDVQYGIDCRYLMVMSFVFILTIIWNLIPVYCNFYFYEI